MYRSLLLTLLALTGCNSGVGQDPDLPAGRETTLTVGTYSSTIPCDESFLVDGVEQEFPDLLGGEPLLVVVASDGEVIIDGTPAREGIISEDEIGGGTFVATNISVTRSGGVLSQIRLYEGPGVSGRETITLSEEAGGLRATSDTSLLANNAGTSIIVRIECEGLVPRVGG